MSWFRIEHKLPSHGKIAPLSDAAFRLHITAGCWCAEHMTDGVIPEAMPEAMTKAPRGKALASTLAELVKAGLWERVEGGYLFHDYLDYNMSRAEYETKRAAGRAGGERSGESRRSKTEAPASNVLEQNRSTSSRSPQAVSVSVSVSENLDSKVLTETAATALRPITREEKPEKAAAAAIPESGTMKTAPKPVALQANSSRSLQERAEYAISHAFESTFDPPKAWPEVIRVAKVFAFALQLPDPKLGNVKSDKKIDRLLELFASGRTVSELEAAAAAAHADPWCRDHLVTLADLSPTVVDRLLGPKRKPKPEPVAEPVGYWTKVTEMEKSKPRDPDADREQAEFREFCRMGDKLLAEEQARKAASNA